MTPKIKILNKPHYCLFCGKELVRKRINGRLEDFTVYQRRKYCNMDCFQNDRILNFSKTHHDQDYRCSHATAQKLAKRFLNTEMCELCGSTKKLDVHHKDEDYNNNNITNLQILCRSCHMKIHKRKQENTNG